MKSAKREKAEKEKKPREKKQISELTKRRTVKAADGILAAFILILSLHSLATSFFVIEDSLEMNNPYPQVALIFVLLGISQLIKIPLHSVRNRKRLFFHLFFVIAFFALATFIFFDRYSVKSLQWAGAGFCLYLIGNRILFTLERRRARDIVFTVLYCLLMLFFFFLFLDAPAEVDGEMFARIILLAMIIFKAFVAILVMSFSEIQMGVLLKIIRKTCTAEILAGLMLLIATFSYVFYVLEPGMETYGDGLWYSFAVVTTIGFGDHAATMGVTRTLSVILGIYGIIVVALITSIIVNFYTEVKDHNEEEEEQ